MSQFWNERVRTLVPYVPGEQPKDDIAWIKLNTNESPYPPAPNVLEAIQSVLGSSLRLYPDPEGTPLREAVAAYYGLEEEEVFVGNGSDEILAFSYMTFFDTKRTIVFPDISYSFYPVYAAHFGVKYERVPLEADFRLSVDRVIEQAQGGGGVLIPNPNAPTGIALPLADIERLLDVLTEQVVIIDEAYVDFGAESAANLIKRYPNLLVVQTLSKSRSLAGLRTGFALGNANLIHGLQRVKHSFNSYTLDRLALAGGVAAIQDKAYFEEMRDRIVATRDRVIGQLSEAGFEVLPSQANFFLMTHPQLEAMEIMKHLREQGILVRYFSLPRIDRHLRVTVGTDGEMDRFLAALQDLLSE